MSAIFGKLSPREQQVAVRIALGEEREATSTALGIGRKSYDTYRKRALAKLGVTNNVQLVRVALLEGVVCMFDELGGAL